MSLRDEQLRSFHDKGFAIVEHFFDEREVAAMQAELERIKHSEAARNVATDGDSKTISQTLVNLQIVPLNKVSNLFRAFPFQPKVLDAVEQCIGVPFVRQLDQIFSKPPGCGSGTDWHQDNAYFQINDPTKAVAMWTALHDASRAGGTLEVLPCSHFTPLHHECDPMSNHHISCVVDDESAAVPVEVDAGGVIFFNYGIAHRTGPNRANHTRAGLAFHFLRTDYIRHDKKSEDYIHLRGDDATEGVREYGVNLSGAWTKQVNNAIANGPGET